MTHPRGAYRAALRAAFEATDDLYGVRILKGWAFPTDAADLPALAVATPRERIELSAVDQVDRTVEIVVVLKTRGGDLLEDVLDNYSDVIEAVAIAAFQAMDPEPELYGLGLVDMTIDGDGDKRLGLLEMRFEAVRYAAEGAQL